MKRSIKRIISFALVMTMLLSTMITVSAEGTIAAENFSVEDELMPLAADPCASNNAAGFSGKPFVYFYNGVNEINLRFDVIHWATGTPDVDSDYYVESVDNMAFIADTYIHRDDDETDDDVNNEICKAVWYEMREDDIWDYYREVDILPWDEVESKISSNVTSICTDQNFEYVITNREMNRISEIFCDWVYNENMAYGYFDFFYETNNN